MSNNIYDILARFNKVTPQQDPVNQTQLNESVVEAAAAPAQKSPEPVNNPLLKDYLRRAYQEFPNAASNEEATLSLIAKDKKEEDAIDAQTQEWMQNAKQKIDAQQNKMNDMAQIIIDQEKRFQDFNKEVSATKLSPQQKAKAAVDFAKAAGKPGASKDAVASAGKNIIDKAKDDAKKQDKEEKPDSDSKYGFDRPTVSDTDKTEPKTQTQTTPPAGAGKEVPKKDHGEGGLAGTAFGNYVAATGGKVTKTPTGIVHTAKPIKYQSLFTSDDEETPAANEPEYKITAANEPEYKITAESINRLLKEQRQEGDPLLGVENFGLIGQALRKADDQVILTFGPNKLPLTASQIYGVAIVLDGISPEAKEAFIHRNLAFFDSTAALIASPQVTAAEKGFPAYQSSNPTWRRKAQQQSVKNNPKQLDLYGGSPTMEGSVRDLNSFNGKNIMSNNIYNILGNFNKLWTKEPTTPTTTAKQPVYESVEPKGDIMEAVKSLEEKYKGFKAESIAVVHEQEAPLEVGAQPKESTGDYSAKKARAGKDIGKPGKNFSKIAKSAGEKYGSKAAGERVAGAVLNKLRHGEELDEGKKLKDKKQFDSVAEPGDYYLTDKGNKVIKTKSGIKHEKVHAADKDDEDKDEVDEGIVDAIGSRIGHAVKGVNRALAGKPSATQVQQQHAIKARAGQVNLGATAQQIAAAPGEEKKAERTGNVLRNVAAQQAGYKNDVDEVAPPGAKAERMVKHIKKGYAKDGKLTKKEKGIAYATAWKAHNKGVVESASLTESRIVESDTTFDHICKRFPAECKKFKSEGGMSDVADISQELYDALYDYYLHNGEMPYGTAKARTGDPYQWINDRFARDLGIVAETVTMEEPLLDVGQELDEIARLAGIPVAKVCPGCGKSACKCDETVMDEASGCSVCNESPCSCMHEEAIMDESTRKHFQAAADIIRALSEHDPEAAKQKAHHQAEVFARENPRFSHEKFFKACGLEECDWNMAPTMTPIEEGTCPTCDCAPCKCDESMMEDEMEEGNEFSGALAKARAEGKKEFEVDGKKYTVKEDININISANGEEDALNLIRKLSGMAEVHAEPIIAVGEEEEELGEDGPNLVNRMERDIENLNTPREDYAAADITTMTGTGLDKIKKARATATAPGDNPLGAVEADGDPVHGGGIKEDSLWKQYEAMLKEVTK